MEMSAIAAKNVANMAYSDWQYILKNKKTEETNNIKVEDVDKFNKGHKNEL